MVISLSTLEIYDKYKINNKMMFILLMIEMEMF